MKKVESHTKRRTALRACVFAVVVAVHLFLVLRAYPPSVFLKGEVPLKGDVSRYFASAFSAASIQGSFGYDPYVMAGYPAGLWNSMGKKGFEVLHALLPGVPLPTLFYLALAGFSFLAPFFVWLAGRRCCASAGGALTLLGACLLYWHLCTQVAYLWNFGNVFFPATACLLPGLAVCAWNVLAGRKLLVSTLAVALLGAVIFYFHTALMAGAGACLLACAMVNPRGLRRWQTWVAAAVGAALFALLAAPWLIPLLRTYGDYRPLVYAGYQGTTNHLFMDLLSDRAYGHPFDRNALFHVAVVLGCAGGWLARRDSKRRVVWAMTLAAGLCLFVAYGFSHVRALQSTQPYRFLVPATLLLIAPLALFVEWAFAGLGKASREVKAVVGLLLLAAAPGFTAYLVDLARPREACGLEETRREVLDLIGKRPSQGRVLCDDVHLGHIIPYYTGRPVIGGLSAEAFTKHGHTGVDYEGRLFGRTPDEWDPELLGSALATYGVDYAVLHKEAWVKFARKPGSPFLPDTRVGGYRLYRVRDASLGLVLEGAGSVAADYDLIRVSDVRQTPLVLKLHYADWLEASNGVRLEPRPVPDDPVPFIRCIVPDGVSEFTISPRG